MTRLVDVRRWAARIELRRARDTGGAGSDARADLRYAASPDRSRSNVWCRSDRCTRCLNRALIQCW
ncbi:hypothetical protein PUN4_550107 [Paraburkholderia unamae]|nr:hypothetical protein PUN4_550107 [Paraburkholderia unamae]